MIFLPLPNKSYPPCGNGEIPDTDQTEALQEAHVFHLADSIVKRNAYKSGAMECAARYIENMAFLRCDDYHETSDTAEKLDYPQFAEVVQGLSRLVILLANKP